MIYTADHDMHVETLSAPPHEAILWGDLANRKPRLPDGLGMRHKRPVYRFATYPSAAQVVGLLRQSAALAKREGAATWGDAPVPGPEAELPARPSAPAQGTINFGDSGFHFGQVLQMEPKDFLRGSYAIGIRRAFSFVGVKVDPSREVSVTEAVRRFISGPS